MLNLILIKSEKDYPVNLTKKDLIDFLFTRLDKFGDPKQAIAKSIDYAFSDEKGKGGFIIAAYEGETLAGALVMNKTGMDEYIPEYILVYVAVDPIFRNKGIGRQIVERAVKTAGAGVALHVEYDNPAKRLYERLGFTSKYAEMRLNPEI